MKKISAFLFAFFLLFSASAQGRMKSVIYDFDGLDTGATDLPDGDYRNGDLAYHVTTNPLASSEVLRDRVLQLDVNWQTGSGEFGKNISRFLELNQATDRLNFYVYNPVSNAADAVIHLSITEDDNKDNVFENNMDDRWISIVTVPRSSSWQLISVPLTAFADSNAGGNGIFDVGYTQAAGMLFAVGFVFPQTNASVHAQTCDIDMLSFSEGALPYGPTILDLPPAGTGSCRLGAASDQSSPDQVPNEIEGIFGNSGKKLSFVNWFLDYGTQGTTADNYPGAEVASLLSRGYRPVITWQMQFTQYSRLDPAQPRLDKLLNGTFDTYINTFADQVKAFNDTIIIRILHEFEGNWYSWSLTENNQDPNEYISAYHYIVDHFRARGANKVKWMWCVNAEPKPYTAYNWIVSAYPGANYVDIVATDIYNHPDLGTPPWKSFRSTLSESYYYLSKYFPDKPLYICEVGCRERDSSEPAASQSKGEWYCAMSRDLQTYFPKVSGLIFFSKQKEHDWRINSSTESVSAVQNCVWNSGYFITDVSELTLQDETYSAYPNPFSGSLRISTGMEGGTFALSVSNTLGQVVYRTQNYQAGTEISACGSLPPGLYFVELKNGSFLKSFKVIRSEN